MGELGNSRVGLEFAKEVGGAAQSPGHFVVSHPRIVAP